MLWRGISERGDHGANGVIAWEKGKKETKKATARETGKKHGTVIRRGRR